MSAIAIATGVGLATGIATFLFGKSVSVIDAAKNLQYKIKFVYFIKPKFPFTEIQFRLDLILTNNSEEKFAFKFADINVTNLTDEIVGSVFIDKSKRYQLNPQASVTIDNVTVSLKTLQIGGIASKVITGIISKLTKGAGLISNITNAVTELNSQSDVILKELKIKMKLEVNNIPLDIEETLAGGETLGHIYLGYSPISARERKIIHTAKYDKYFPLPQGKKQVLQRNANVEQTVRLMIDVVNKDAHLIKKASFEIFKRPTVEQTASNIFDWIYKYIKYDIEDGEQLRNPLMTYHLGQRKAREFYVNHGYYHKDYSADCDDMSIFIASILKNLGIPYNFRIASYKDILGMDSGYSHVYTIIPRKGKQDIIIDPVYFAFNSEKEYSKQKTFDMNKNRLNGIDVMYLSGINGTSEAYDVLHGIDLLGGTNNEDVDMYNYLVKSRNQIAKNPNAVRHILEPARLLEMYDYAIQHWFTPQRNIALQILSDFEDKISGSFRGYGELGKLKFFNKLKDKYTNWKEKRKENKATKG